MPLKRCAWVTDDPLYLDYHDKEWGVPVYDDDKLFEFLVLEGMQAGLSWITILKKRDNYRKAFEKFNAKKIVKFDENDVARLLQNEGIIRNKLKVNAIINNAKCYLDVKKQYGDFASYIWDFVGGKPITNRWEKSKDVPANNELSDQMSKSLKKHGFKFVGTTICYAYMQATGMINDHEVGCFRYKHCT